MSETSDSAMGSLNFAAVLERRGPVAIVRAAGELDIAAAPTLTERLHEANEPGVRLLVVDLSEVTLLDSTGLGALIEQIGELEANGSRIELRLVVREPHVLRVFSITGLDGVFSIFPTTEDALALPV